MVKTYPEHLPTGNSCLNNVSYLTALFDSVVTEEREAKETFPCDQVRNVSYLSAHLSNGFVAADLDGCGGKEAKHKTAPTTPAAKSKPTTQSLPCTPSGHARDFGLNLKKTHKGDVRIQESRSIFLREPAQAEVQDVSAKDSKLATERCTRAPAPNKILWTSIDQGGTICKHQNHVHICWHCAKY